MKIVAVAFGREIRAGVLERARALGGELTVVWSGPRERGASERSDGPAARFVRVSDAPVPEAAPHTTGEALAVVCRKLGADLVVALADAATAVIPAAVAAHLDASYVSAVESVSPSDGGAVVVDKRAGGRVRTLRVPLPAVVTLVARPDEAPVADVDNVDTLTLTSLGFVASKPETTPFVKTEAPKKKAATAADVDELVDRLRG